MLQMKEAHEKIETMRKKKIDENQRIKEKEKQKESSRKVKKEKQARRLELLEAEIL